jgi:hypothetical protein
MIRTRLTPCSLPQQVDDGLSIEQLPSGDVKLWVHVADPTRWLQPGGWASGARRHQVIHLALSRQDMSAGDCCQPAMQGLWHHSQA